ncbi:MAG: hypothetical protein ACP5EP_08210 [Acidobacteriaceae bacterium]
MTQQWATKGTGSIAKGSHVWFLPRASLGNSVIKIAVSIAAGAFLVWIVNVDWVLEIMAEVIILACAVLGAIAGHWVYNNLSKSNPHWMRLTVAIILGLSIWFAVSELTRSHKLIRDYDHYSSDYDE